MCNKHAFCSTCLESRPNVRSSIHLLRSTAQLTAFPFAPSSTLTHTFIFPRSSCLLSFSLVTNLQLITFQALWESEISSNSSPEIDGEPG
ncbi:unnamed protein product [Lactuca saligna]|uniref:Uncharacterized protein n=1 Tax=Lactuca saligna TaxID=75948 RepID=A0AA35VQ93_LACSI|nr:unnamed protein product [Lactuca saligna]